MTGPPTPGLLAYRLATGLAAPLARPWLRRRLAAGKEDPARWRERLGHPSRERPPGRLAWLHGASVGEGLALLPIAESIGCCAPGCSVLITVGTRAASQLISRRAPAGVMSQYGVLDEPFAVSRFLRHWRPDLGVFVESELWPNLILGAKARGARLALVSAKLSPASLRGWRRAPAAARAVLGAFDLVLARDAAAADGLASLGTRVDGLADLKFGAPPLPGEPAELSALREASKGRPILLAASTHPGEDEPILAAFAAARQGAPGVLVIAPRHVERAADIEALARAAGLRAGRRTQAAALADVDVYIADTVGELGLWYRLARLAVIGGSLVAQGAGGHNPLEPARLACPFVAGPHVEAWPVYAELETACATRFAAAPELAGLLRQAIDAPETFTAMAQRAQAFAAAGDEAARAALPRILALLA